MDIDNKIYSFSDLTDKTQEYLKMPKRPVNGTPVLDWPKAGCKLNIELISDECKKIKFFLDIYESKLQSSILLTAQPDRKSTTQARYASNVMIRIDFSNNQELLKHRNPDGTMIYGNHIHLDVPHYGSKFAVPISQQDIIVAGYENGTIYPFFESLLRVDSISDKLIRNYSLGV